MSDSNEDMALKGYRTFAREIVGDNPLGKAYLEKVKSLGYNALVDDNDAGQLSDVPMILLDAAKTTKTRTAVELNREMEKAAKKRLVEVLDIVHLMSNAGKQLVHDMLFTRKGGD